MGGTLTKSLPCRGWLLVRRYVSPPGGAAGWNAVYRVVGGSPSTLLGPEATGRA
jgi:hypothetical protein